MHSSLEKSAWLGGGRPRKLNEFVAAVLENRKFYNLIAVARFPKRSAEYFANQLEFVRENYGKVTSHEEFAEQSFFCSALVVACYAVVGIIGETARVPPRPLRLHRILHRLIAPASVYRRNIMAGR
jgi:hypothetical protein